MIYVVPESGLCNRMRVIQSGILLAKHRKTKLAVFWKKNNDVGAEFFELFNPPKEFQSIRIYECKGLGYFDQPYQSFFTGFRSFSKPRQVKIDEIQNSEFMAVYLKEQSALQEGVIPEGNYESEIMNLWDRDLPGKSLYINSYSRFFGAVLPDFKFFTPSAKILSSASKIMKDFGAFTIGVHIRRTDNADSIEKSTTQKFIYEINRLLEIHSSATIFLATDSFGERVQFLEQYGRRVISSDFEISRTSISGMQHALTELYCLSKCNYILGSFYSSFSETAFSYNGNKPFTIIQ